MNILVFDNYDSFTYNLVHLVEKITGRKVSVFRNDEIPLEKVKDYDKIILSPGPGIPEEAGLLLPLIKEYASGKSIFGVCLGLQAIGQAFGADLINLKDVYNGVATDVTVTNRVGRLFEGLPDHFPVGRYHSWVVDEWIMAHLITAHQLWMNLPNLGQTLFHQFLDAERLFALL